MRESIPKGAEAAFKVQEKRKAFRFAGLLSSFPASVLPGDGPAGEGVGAARGRGEVTLPQDGSQLRPNGR